ncbi:MAG TPA: hypothetical protein VF824_15830 [Thermoanaerobaculia bacterium]|jgi:Tfp pilus assembly protein PilO
MIWREKRILLLILGVLLAANTLFFFTYRVRYQSRLDELDERKAAAQAQLNEARAARLQAEATLQSYKRVESDVAEIYDHHWATRAERLTALIGEVKHLAVASNLEPPAYAFDQKAVEVQSVSGRGRQASVGANEVGIAFSVEGTYGNVRRLINLLELSRQFVIIDSIGLTAREGQNLSLTIHLKTLFRDAAADAGQQL